ncbi:anti-sigma factor [Cecembia rubra]|uniref:Anti-sigma-K factor rskA n=1 Tax=Cecembia rubra TaxID=1485585 RepID=A0A2P8E1S6_9BACT|nr:anti-sigma factor [Cecembia rubra]PSL03367.1 anti-sigma-K factor rskA [Cecembia rubra]
MDIQAYISSGKLELFLLGELNEREQQEVMEMAARYPAIQKELEELEQSMFAFDHRSGINPSEGVKNRIMETLYAGEQPTDAALPAAEKERNATTDGGIHRNISFPWKIWAVAASLAALIASAAALYFATRYYQSQEDYLALMMERSVLAEELDIKQTRFEQVEEVLAGDFERVSLSGTAFEIQEDAKLNVFWNPDKALVYVTVQNLALLGADQDYQLWAIGEDGPIGIGLINPQDKNILQKMDAVVAAGAFAITIEPKGGSLSPTLEKLVALGEVA